MSDLTLHRRPDTHSLHFSPISLRWLTWCDQTAFPRIRSHWQARSARTLPMSISEPVRVYCIYNITVQSLQSGSSLITMSISRISRPYCICIVRTTVFIKCSEIPVVRNETNNDDVIRSSVSLLYLQRYNNRIRCSTIPVVRLILISRFGLVRLYSICNVTVTVFRCSTKGFRSSD